MGQFPDWVVGQLSDIGTTNGIRIHTFANLANTESPLDVPGVQYEKRIKYGNIIMECTDNKGKYDTLDYDDYEGCSCATRNGEPVQFEDTDGDLQGACAIRAKKGKNRGKFFCYVEK